MQQTTKYQFNLVDATDDFSPAPLNQNMEKVEEELSGLSTALTQGLEEVEDSITALEDSVDTQLAAVMANLGAAGKNARIAWGSYTGTGTYGQDTPTVFACDFKPMLVIVGWQDYQYSPPLVLVHGVDLAPTEFFQYQAVSVIWEDRQVKIYSTDAEETQFNKEGHAYRYLILGYDNT